MPVRDWNCPKQNLKHSLCCAQQCWEGSSFNRNSHLVNLSDAAFRHQWTGADNVVQPAGHNLYENIRCRSPLLDHCPSNHDASRQYTPGTGKFCASALFPSTIVSPCYFDAIKKRWVKWMLGEATIDCPFCHSSGLTSYLCSLSVHPQHEGMVGPVWAPVELLPHIVRALPWCINFSIVWWLLYRTPVTDNLHTDLWWLQDLSCREQL